MLAGKKGIERIETISKRGLVSGISMAIESGDQNVRKLLLDRHENNSIVLDAIKNVKNFGVPLRTQAIVGLPVIKPSLPFDSKRNTNAACEPSYLRPYIGTSIDPFSKTIPLSKPKTHLKPSAIHSSFSHVLPLSLDLFTNNLGVLT